MKELTLKILQATLKEAMDHEEKCRVAYELARIQVRWLQQQLAMESNNG